jgi:hypothetical protein
MRLTVFASLLTGSIWLRVNLEKKSTLTSNVSLRLVVIEVSGIVIAYPLEDSEPEPMPAPNAVLVKPWPAEDRDVV